MNIILSFEPLLKEIKKLPRYAPDKLLRYADVKKVLNAWIVEVSLKYPTVEQAREIKKQR
jgi:hypothetical protein